MNKKSEKINILIDLSRYTQAIELLKDELASDPDNYRSHLEIAYCELQENKFEEAEAECAEAIMLDPVNSLAYSILALIGILANDLVKAKENIEIALSLEPENASHYSLLSKILIIEDNYPAALEAAEKGLELEPDHSSCLEYKAESYLFSEQYDLALKAMNLSLEQDPENANTLMKCGLIFYFQRNYSKAVVYFNEAIRINPDNETLNDLMPIALFQTHILSKIFSALKLDAETTPLLIVAVLLLLASVFSVNSSLTLYLPVVLTILSIILLRNILFFFIVHPLVLISLKFSSLGHSWVSDQETQGVLKRLGATAAVIIGILSATNFIGLSININTFIIVLDFAYFFLILVERNLTEQKFNLFMSAGFATMAILAFLMPPVDSIIISQVPYLLGLIGLSLYESFRHRIGISRYSRIVLSIFLCFTLYFLVSVFHSTHSKLLSSDINKNTSINQPIDSPISPAAQALDKRQIKEDKDRFNLTLNTTDLFLSLSNAGYDCKYSESAISIENPTYRKLYTNISKSQVQKLSNIIQLRCKNTLETNAESTRQIKKLKPELDRIDKSLYSLSMKLINEFTGAKY
jgi:tetratricopeptide (TPR) repeat protein